MVAKHCDGDCGNKDCKIAALEDQLSDTWALIQAARDFKSGPSWEEHRIRIEGLEDEINVLKIQVDMLRDALSQMDLTICSMGDLMTKEDQQEALRLEALRDRVLKETE